MDSVTAPSTADGVNHRTPPRRAKWRTWRAAVEHAPTLAEQRVARLLAGILKRSARRRRRWSR